MVCISSMPVPTRAVLSLDLKVGGNNRKVAGQAKILSSKHRALTRRVTGSWRENPLSWVGGLPRGNFVIWQSKWWLLHPGLLFYNKITKFGYNESPWITQNTRRWSNAGLMLKGLAQLLINMTIWCKHVNILELKKFFNFCSVHLSVRLDIKTKFPYFLFLTWLSKIRNLA